MVNFLTVKSDVSNPASPQDRGAPLRRAIGWSLFSHRSGHHRLRGFIYSDSLTVIDVSNPASPQIVGHVTDAKLMEPDQVTSGHHRLRRFSFSDSLTVIDVSNPASPQIVGHVTDAKLNGAYSVTVAGTTAYVASRDSDSLTVIDVSNPASPQIRGARHRRQIGPELQISHRGGHHRLRGFIGFRLP